MSIPEALKKLAFYGSGNPEDTPVEIGYLDYEPMISTIYYKVKRVGRYTFIYFYLYFPWDKNHLHDWTGGMIVLYDGVPVKLVCRSHWDMVVETADEACPYLFIAVTSGDHSLRPVATSLPPDMRLFYDLRDGDDVVRLEEIRHPTLIELTDEHSEQIRQIAKTASITHHETWGDQKALTWCRYFHPFQYKALCKKHGAYTPAPWWKVWAKQFPKPSEVYDKHPALWLEIMEVVYG